MSKKNQLFTTPPYAIEQRLNQLGADLRTARIRRNLTIAEVAEKIGTGVRAVADAEKGKASTSIAVYLALLWVYGLLEQMVDVANPIHDVEGRQLALLGEKTRVRIKSTTEILDNDF